MDIRGIIALMRPKQWIKNFFVFAAVIFSGNLMNEGILKNNIITFILFCLTSSTIYILNDIVDIEKDRKHPEKKNRPLPSGRVSKSTAIIMNIVMLFIVLFCSYKFVDYKVMYIYLMYIVINILYCFKLKNVVILDVMVITFGFVLRVESGSLATKVSVSPWLFLCTILLSLFLALNKRKSEIITLKDKSGSHRKILEEYSIELIDNMLTIVTPSILISYCLYTFSSVQSKRMMYTIPFVLYGIFRYQYLMTNHNLGGKPEAVFGKDKPFLVNMVLWVISVVVIIYFKL
ncbi:decaprenyl-phosphate phosphoribosyltransferase [Clostridium sporogenes]|uniref:Decaprenyl-phosphate phosphoribosyltransferase n=1 Tax=Clostridium botulinum TaxID=1491 RepID=A0A6M0T7S1_CLOBO|nr:decaprenyl-phosphate phosphoribosyltransferase [Clostridium sporogenes]NFA62181.1 decaprenyl-phosphate phosphoribosyltransferase [Clostridium botulinum]NFI72768.1 decaprenyl-phosphate phosphoribosyltransferase [Clostridium sporogenes]NFP60181.1 decaprenyl-phosphate phosphoribosyltransferase [Clostridium sporogenes]NFU93610.1 decaprenyl-phosphate phosphoribosyltransferase [Clostridium sporogenes]NFV69372.1 decaprenyl-phosphate phosphoribosyltransferase [Clostridium botulinum]